MSTTRICSDDDDDCATDRAVWTRETPKNPDVKASAVGMPLSVHRMAVAKTTATRRLEWMDMVLVLDAFVDNRLWDEKVGRKER